MTKIQKREKEARNWQHPRKALENLVRKQLILKPPKRVVQLLMNELKNRNNQNNQDLQKEMKEGLRQLRIHLNNQKPVAPIQPGAPHKASWSRGKMAASTSPQNNNRNHANPTAQRKSTRLTKDPPHRTLPQSLTIGDERRTKSSQTKIQIQKMKKKVSLLMEDSFHKTSTSDSTRTST